MFDSNNKGNVNARPRSCSGHYTPYSYTKEEDDIIRKYKGIYTYKEISKRFLPHRSVNSIRTRAQLIGISKKSMPKWNDEEIKLLKKLASEGKTTGEILIEFPNRSKLAIRNKLFILGIKTKRKMYKNKYCHGDYKIWTQKEIDFLYEKAGSWKVNRVAKKLGRTKESIYQKCNDLGINWRQGTIKSKEIERIVGVSNNCVRNHLKKMRMFRPSEFINDPDVPAKIAQSILNDEKSLSNSNVSLKHLEAVARGEYEFSDRKIKNDKKCSISKELITTNMVAWENEI